MTSWKNQNAVYNNIGLEQGIEPGSPNWILGGLKPISGDTGSHPAYGWKHHHMVKQYGAAYAQWVVANYSMRPCYYDDAPARHTDYTKGGRPLDWKPEVSNDHLNGSHKYETSMGDVFVSGPDILHFQISPLFAVFDHPEHFVTAQGSSLSVSWVAGALIRELIESLVGQVSLSKDKFNPLPSWADRGYACFLGAIVEAAKRGLIYTNDQNRAYAYIFNVLVPFYEKAPGLAVNMKDPPITGIPNIQVYNGLYWVLPRFYDLYRVLPVGAEKERILKIVKRMSQEMLDLEAFLPGKGTKIASVSIPDKEFLVGINGAPCDSWLKFLKPEYVHGVDVPGKTNWQPWGIRAQFVAAEILESQVMADAAVTCVAAVKADKTFDNRAWLVDHEGEYV